MSVPVVCLHAGVCDHRMWDGLREALPERTFAAPDLRGFGTRPRGVRPFSHVADVLALLDAIDAERVHLVGASFGGQVALQVAARAPERVASLALLAPALPEWDHADPELLAYAEAEEAALGRGDLDRAVELNVEMWAGDDPEVRRYVAEAQRRAFELGGEDDDLELEEPALDLAAITADTLVLAGDRDVSDFVAIARHLAERLPGPELRLVEGAGHLLVLERPDEVAGALAEWLRDR